MVYVFEDGHPPFNLNPNLWCNYYYFIVRAPVKNNTNYCAKNIIKLFSITYNRRIGLTHSLTN